jgi:hypothetical protein
MKKKYDGISFVDESKAIYIDYIPVDKSALPENANFLSDKAIVITENVLPPNGQENEWILIQWNLPPQATAEAGTVKF